MANWRGTWASGTAYAADDSVTYGGVTYFCVTANTGQTPGTGADWALQDVFKGTGTAAVIDGDVKTAILSHLHQDHIGGLSELSHADIVVSQAEWDTLSSPLPELRGLMRRHIDLPGLRWR